MNKPAKPRHPKPRHPPRRVVQMAAAYAGVFVLLDDDSLWFRSATVTSTWHRVPGPPGTELQEGTE